MAHSNLYFLPDANSMVFFRAEQVIGDIEASASMQSHMGSCKKHITSQIGFLQIQHGIWLDFSKWEMAIDLNGFEVIDVSQSHSCEPCPPTFNLAPTWPIRSMGLPKTNSLGCINHNWGKDFVIKCTFYHV